MDAYVHGESSINLFMEVLDRLLTGNGQARADYANASRPYLAGKTPMEAFDMIASNRAREEAMYPPGHGLPANVNAPTSGPGLVAPDRVTMRKLYREFSGPALSLALRNMRRYRQQGLGGTSAILRIAIIRAEMRRRG